MANILRVIWYPGTKKKNTLFGNRVVWREFEIYCMFVNLMYCQLAIKMEITVFALIANILAT